MNRRNALKMLSMSMATYALPGGLRASDSGTFRFETIFPKHYKVPMKPVTAITLGAGARGNTYGNFAVNFPEMLKIVGVAEPNIIRKARYSQKHTIDERNQFDTWEDVFQRPKFADAIIITTPDDLHYGPCMAALDLGYDILLEKPIAPTAQECRDILTKSKETGRIVAVCHVLRYAPYFQKMQTLLQSEEFGPIMSMHHFEPIEHIHMAHSFVRGNWHDSKATTPIILAKSCHDMDIMRWLIGSPCKQVAAFGDLSWFKSENAPKGSTDRCLDGCQAESTCPYSAKKIYLKNKWYTYVFDLPDDKSAHHAAIEKYLHTTDYGRCVYKMDNDQPDHYVCAMQFERGITASFNMEAFTSFHGRRTKVMGSMGDIVGDMNEFKWTDFRTGAVKTFDGKADDVDNYQNSGHGGGDWRLVGDWIMAISQQNPELLTSTIEQSIESHLMAFAAENSRLNGIMASVK
jgi:hypothetical protein